MKSVKCPTCKRAVEWSELSKYRPFCSDRCRLIDLGAWFNEDHAIPGEPLPEDDTDDSSERDES